MAKQNWTIAVPIFNLEICDDIGGLLQIERVTFVSAKKIPRIRKKLNIPFKISTLNKKFRSEPPVFNEAKTYAFISTNKQTDDEFYLEHNLIREAIWLLRSSQFARGPSTTEYFFGLPEHSARLITEEYRFEVKGQKGNWKHSLESPIQAYKLDKTWENFITHHFFPNLLKVVNKRFQIKSQWRKAIRKASILAAKSYYSSELSEAFLFNVIALETLLNSGEQNEQVSRSLYERLFALFGWMSRDNPKNIQQIVDRIYKLRCEFVHHGDYQSITVHDLINTDEILSNLLFNICNNIHFFSDRARIVQLSKEIQARRLLGLKLKRPKSLTYTTLTSNRSPKQIETLRKKRKW